MGNNLLGLDVGTSGCKAVVFDLSGKKIASSSRNYSLIFPRDGWMELDPSLVVNCALDCIKSCVVECGDKKIAALAISSQGEAIIPVDGAGNPLMNAIVTFDNRNRDEYAWFSERFDKEYVMRITGAPIHTMFSLLKILWIKNNLPEVYGKTWKFMCFGDYLSYRLGAEAVIDYSMASRTMAFDIVKKEWSLPLLESCGIPVSKMPKAAPSGTIIGKVSEAAAHTTGLSAETFIVTGGHDQACCALGAGVLRDGTAMDSLGTTESIVCVSKALHVTNGMMENNLPCYCYTIDGMYAYLSFLSSSGGILKWFHDGILGASEGYSYFNEAAAKEYPGYSGLLLLPHFAGSGTPYLDFDSKGVIAGLTLGTSKYQIYKAIIEATCFESRLNIERMEQSGITLNELYCVGGGSKSALWLQLKADITGKTVISLDVPEFGCLGAAMLAGLGAGVYKDAESAFKSFEFEKTLYAPVAESKEIYNAVYRKYEKLYALSKELI